MPRHFLLFDSREKKKDYGVDGLAHGYSSAHSFKS